MFLISREKKYLVLFENKKNTIRKLSSTRLEEKTWRRSDSQRGGKKRSVFRRREKEKREKREKKKKKKQKKSRDDEGSLSPPLSPWSREAIVSENVTRDYVGTCHRRYHNVTIAKAKVTITFGVSAHLLARFDTRECCALVPGRFIQRCLDR